MTPLHLIWSQAFEIPSTRAHALQVLQTSQALAVLGHRPEVFAWTRDAEAARRYLAELPGEPTEALGVVLLRPWARAFLGATLRRALRSRLESAGPRTVFYARHLRHAAWLLRRRGQRPIPVLYELHNLEHRASNPATRRGLALARLERWVLETCDHVVAISKPLLDDARDFARLRGVSLLEDGVALSAFQAGPIPVSDTLHLTYAGSLYAHKGVDSLVEMMLHLASRFHLSIHGGNEPMDLLRLRTLAGLLGVADRVRFTGQRPASEIPQLLADAHIVLLPTSDHVMVQRYTSPLKLFEALAVGRPIVAAPSASALSVLTPELAYLATDGTPEALARAVQRAEADRAHWAGRAATCRAAAAAFSWPRRAERLADLADEVLARVREGTSPSAASRQDSPG